MLKAISQSFIKEFRDYNAGEGCGLQIKEKYVHGRSLDFEDEPGAKELGTYGEFMITGALPRSGKMPVPVMLKNGGMDVRYRVATVNAKRVLEMFAAYKLKIISSNLTTTKNDFTGTIDVVVEYTGTEDFQFDTGIVWKPGDCFVIDIKFSGLVRDTTPHWNKLGWKWSDTQKKYHGTQAKQYNYLLDLPVYFLVIQTNNKEEEESLIKFFYTPVDEFMREQHLLEGRSLFKTFQAMVKHDTGLEARPSYERCRQCPLYDECEFKHVYPQPEVINLNTD